MLCSMWNLISLTREKTQISALLPESHSSRDQLGFQPHFHFQKWCSQTSRTCSRSTTAVGSTLRKGLLCRTHLPLTCHFTSILGPGLFCVCPFVQPLQAVSMQPTPVLSPGLSSEAQVSASGPCTHSGCGSQKGREVSTVCVGLSVFCWLQIIFCMPL